MKKLLIICLSIGLLTAFGCDEPAEEEPEQQDEAEVQQDDEAVEQQDDEEAQADEEEADEEEEYAEAEDGVIAVTAGETYFEPSNIKAAAGDLTVEFTRNTEDGCMTEVVFPDLDIEEELPEGETVAVELEIEEGDEIGFECGMGMGESVITGT